MNSSFVKSFASYSELQKFFNENKEMFYKKELPSYERFCPWCDPTPLVLDGVTELVEVFDVRQQNDYKGEFEYFYWSDFVRQYIKDLKTGKLYRFTHTKKMYQLLNPSDSKASGRNFKFEEKEPNRIGKATEKKLRAWFDYLEREKTAYDEFCKKNESEREKFISEISALGKIVWTSPNETSGVVRSKYFDLEFQAPFDGYCSKKIKFARYSFETDLELFKLLAKL